MAPSDAQIRRGGAARERILETAYDLFSRSGTRAVGVDTIIAESGVAKMTLYRNFASKDDLILEFLRQRDERWTRAWLQAEVTEREERPGARMLAIFDVFGEWFERDDFEGCAFINVGGGRRSRCRPVAHPHEGLDRRGGGGRHRRRGTSA
jgi:AcrR family transcriptional regulator